MRGQLARRINYSQKKSAQQEVALVSGDRVVCKNTQYTSKTSKRKFEVSDGQVKEYRVLSVSKGIVEVEDISTNVKSTKHESQLKLMPKSPPSCGRRTVHP